MANKVILAQSPYLRPLLKDNKEIKETKFDEYCLEKIMDFLYGKNPTIKIAQWYQVFLLSKKWKLSLMWNLVKKVSKLKTKKLFEILIQIKEQKEKNSAFKLAVMKRLKSHFLDVLKKDRKEMAVLAGHDDLIKEVLSLKDKKLPPLIISTDLAHIKEIPYTERFGINMFDLYKNRSMVNLQLKCVSGKKFFVHKEVFILKSGFFSKYLEKKNKNLKLVKSPLRECPKMETLDLDLLLELDEESMEGMIKFVYTNHLGNDPNELLKILLFCGIQQSKYIFAKIRKLIKKNKNELVGIILNSAYLRHKMTKDIRKQYKNCFLGFLQKSHLNQLMEQSDEFFKEIIELENQIVTQRKST